MEYTLLLALGIFAALACSIVGSFLLYHLYLVWQGMTTNESFKWDDLKDTIKRDGKVQVGRTREDAQLEAKYLIKGKPVTEREVTNASELKNVYRRGGFLAGLWEVMWPPSLHRKKTK